MISIIYLQNASAKVYIHLQNTSKLRTYFASWLAGMAIQTFFSYFCLQNASAYNFMRKQPKRSECPVSCSLDIWGDKWSLLIVRDLMFAKECTYGDFLKA